MMLTQEPVSEYLAKLASNAPAPGGGSAAALAGALGVALAEMAANFTVGKEKFAAVEADVRRVLDTLEAQHGKLLGLVNEDAVAYGQVSGAYAMPRATAEEKSARTVAIQEALRAASAVPFGICECAAAVAAVLDELAAKANPNLISDVGCAARLVVAAMDCGRLNVEINYSGIKDAEFVARGREHLGRIATSCAEQCDRVWSNVVAAICPPSPAA
jgi:methenyltetrahydrofolate cyclohydrolase